jgi:hypothetical protein
MVSDPLAAEIAAHTEARIGRPGREERAICAECYEPWEPCLVRRLADRVAVLTTEAALVMGAVMMALEDLERRDEPRARDVLRAILDDPDADDGA